MRCRPSVVLVLAAACGVAGCDGPAADRKRMQDEHEQKLAEMRRDGDRREAEHRKKIAEYQEATAVARMKARLTGTLAAYQRATTAAGRPPAAADDLTPHLDKAETMTSPRTGEPFEVAWGASPWGPTTGQLRVWERTPDERGGRWVLVTPVDARYVTGEEFAALRRRPDPVPLPTEPAQKVEIVPPPGLVKLPTEPAPAKAPPTPPITVPDSLAK